MPFCKKTQTIYCRGLYVLFCKEVEVFTTNTEHKSAYKKRDTHFLMTVHIHVHTYLCARVYEQKSVYNMAPVKMHKIV